jgi:hypothetical protein
MSPPRAQRAYRPPRRRREVALAVAGSLAVVLVTGGLLWLFAPSDETSTPNNTPLTLPTGLPTSTAPGATATTAPATTPTSTHG